MGLSWLEFHHTSMKEGGRSKRVGGSNIRGHEVKLVKEGREDKWLWELKGCQRGHLSR